MKRILQLAVALVGAISLASLFAVTTPPPDCHKVGYDQGPCCMTNILTVGTYSGSPESPWEPAQGGGATATYQVECVTCMAPGPNPPHPPILGGTGFVPVNLGCLNPVPVATVPVAPIRIDTNGWRDPEGNLFVMQFGYWFTNCLIADGTNTFSVQSAPAFGGPWSCCTYGMTSWVSMVTFSPAPGITNWAYPTNMFSILYDYAGEPYCTNWFTYNATGTLVALRSNKPTGVLPFPKKGNGTRFYRYVRVL